MSSRPGSRVDLNKFCQTEGWVQVRNARGQKVRHHVTWELRLLSGKVLRTRISRPVNTETYGSALWSAILTDQIQVSEAEFWACVDDGVLSQREPTQPHPPTHALPLALVRQLQRELHMPEEAIASLQLPQAMELLHRHWSKPSS